MKKIKILNDPVGGFIRISDEVFSRIIDHRYFQRLRRIRQLGLTDLVFPGATHNRFQHTLGAFQLMNESLEVLKLKSVEISTEEELGVKLAILMHDIGHGPFSHSLEYAIVPGISHEQISRAFMQHLNREFNGALDLAIEIFEDKHPRHFFHQLISSQIDVDRLDYLRRDSFFSGVSEGTIGSERIIRMMNVKDDELVIEKKGIYSIENFLIARRLMYWQVYLHKTVIGAERLLVGVLRRAKELARRGVELFCSPSLRYFLYNDIEIQDFNNSKVLDNFAALDDTDIMNSIKTWATHKDIVLSSLSKSLIDRQLFKVEISENPFEKNRLEKLERQVELKMGVAKEDAGYFVITDSVKNSIYDLNDTRIKILINKEETIDILDRSGGLDISLISDPVQRYFLCYPKQLHN